MSTLIRGYEVVIGFETHTQLSTASKIFSGASTEFGAEPNTQASAVDLALPGTLPVLNRGAVERAIRLGLAVNATVAPLSIFARNNYFYPDLPKGYQISQYEIPVVQGGTVPFMHDGQLRTLRLTRAHLEEDAGKSVHEGLAHMSGIDLNRAGTPLLEIVTEPDLRSSTEAVDYAKALHALVQWLGICDGNMQEGSFRCDANVSVRRPGAPFGTRREIKNLNSFRHLQQAIDYEINWQIDEIEDGRRIRQATVLFDPDTGVTQEMRTKEDAQDYRYFPDPDLPPLVISREWVEQVRAQMPELPRAMAERFVKVDGLPEYDAAMMTQSLATARFYEAARDAGAPAKLVANWIMGEISKRLNAEGRVIAECPVSAESLANLITALQAGVLTRPGALQVFEEMWSFNADENLLTLEDVQAIAKRLGALPMNDLGALEAILDEVLAANQKSVDEFKAGKEKAFQALVGQAMKASKGKANPAQVNELLKKKLGA
ncbi:MAG TPA: Asp-tRNA(Asn)/Glu-tRNA(Gln) amidotransferase subunit GatB [Burkholderiaceae bacterium]|nr:Asp-tRNA(Asn)/Glu-tRNA(Gln) amidotransferase subunit GatB [Burkholderiaceae bacterium]